MVKSNFELTQFLLSRFEDWVRSQWGIAGFDVYGEYGLL